ncbi:MAG: hypothetical protein IK080_04170 [Clostridia bacterium]|nr:hypothetical protein [Clostridia bacterium]
MVQVVNKTLRVMGAIRKDDGTALKPEIAALIDDAEALEKIRTLMLEGLKEAGEKRQAAMANGTAQAGGRKKHRRSGGV